jgi:hypothetical protein
VSERVAFRLVLPGVVVTWFVTGFPDPGKAGGSHAVPLEPVLASKTSLRWRGESSKDGNMQARFHAAVPAVVP